MGKLPHRNHYQMRAATQADTTNKVVTQPNAAEDTTSKEVQGTKSKAAEASKGEMGGSIKQSATSLQVIASAINQLLEKDRVEKPVRIMLERILKFIKTQEEVEKKKVVISVAYSEVSTSHKELKQDLAKMHEALATQIGNIQATMSSALANTAKTLADTKELTETTKEIASKVGKVNDAANKITTTTQSYSNALKHSPAAMVKHSLDPKVLGDMECKA